MERIAYDFHLHSCLSPCGSLDMTPCNVVNMAKLLGFDMIALTDHNSCLNCQAAVEAGERAGILVIPGMELCTMEEAHVICLFPTVQDAMAFHQYVWGTIPPLQNQPEIFGRQVIMDSMDQTIGEEQRLLISAAQISVSCVAELAGQYHGAAFPAHIDKSSYSILSALGAVPEDAGFHAVEVSFQGNLKNLRESNPEINRKILLRNSDAHYLEHMQEPCAWMELPEKTAGALIGALNGKIPVKWGISEVIRQIF